jgi:hypothetical protein
MTRTRVDQLLDIARRVSSGEVPPYEHNECFTSGAFDLLLVHAQGAEAFDLLGQLCARFPVERNAGGDLRGYYSLLSQLARQTNTTEMPKGMAEVLAASPELSGDLRDWYRAA